MGIAIYRYHGTGGGFGREHEQTVSPITINGEARNTTLFRLSSWTIYSTNLKRFIVSYFKEMEMMQLRE